jgi:hypothetical protein
MKKKDTAKGRIEQLEADFDSIVHDLKNTPMTKAQYDEIQSYLFRLCEGMYQEAQEL